MWVFPKTEQASKGCARQSGARSGEPLGDPAFAGPVFMTPPFCELRIGIDAAAVGWCTDMSQEPTQSRGAPTPERPSRALGCR